MLEQIGNTGLYAMNAPVLYSQRPHDILPRELDVVDIFRDEAANELVRRLLEFSNELNRWVGVSWPALMSSLEQEQVRYNKLVMQNKPVQEAYRKALRNYESWNGWTLGLYGYLREPPLPAADLELAALEERVAWTVAGNREQLGLAASKLHRDGYLDLKYDRPCNNHGIEVFFLTKELIWKYVSKKA
jgi:hypothetical protein